MCCERNIGKILFVKWSSATQKNANSGHPMWNYSGTFSGSLAKDCVTPGAGATPSAAEPGTDEAGSVTGKPHPPLRGPQKAT